MKQHPTSAIDKRDPSAMMLIQFEISVQLLYFSAQCNSIARHFQSLLHLLLSNTAAFTQDQKEGLRIAGLLSGYV